jgi:Mrp family chromosome partitioning ATPase
MVDLTSEMAALWAALGPAPAHRGRVIQIAAAATGEGVSTVAREYARLAAVRARRPVWLIDADLPQQGQVQALTAQVVDVEGRTVHPARLIAARPFLGGRLWATQFAGERLRSGQRAEILAAPGYWDALRRHADTVVIDAPAADRSDASILLAPFVDATVLVVAAGSTAAREPLALRDEIEAVGGRIAGVVVNRSTYQPPAFLRRLTG